MGGVNEKIEGFFRCLPGGEGLDGDARRVHLTSPTSTMWCCGGTMSSRAVRTGRFHIWSHRTPSTRELNCSPGCPAGQRGPDGQFPEGTLHAQHRRSGSVAAGGPASGPTRHPRCHFRSTRSSAGATSSIWPIFWSGGSITRLDSTLAGKRVVICAGAGGVGKTTVSATVALGLAAQGGRVALVTIDPARRLGGGRSASMRSATSPRSWTRPGSGVLAHPGQGRAGGNDARREADVR